GIYNRDPSRDSTRLLFFKLQISCSQFGVILIDLISASVVAISKGLPVIIPWVFFGYILDKRFSSYFFCFNKLQKVKQVIVFGFMLFLFEFSMILIVSPLDVVVQIFS